MPKRKAEANQSAFFVKKFDSYVKPSITERVIGQASLVWADLKELGLSAKPVSKWTLKQKESFIKAINKYSCITGKGDVPGAEVGDLYAVMEKVTQYFLDGNDVEMQMA